MFRQEQTNLLLSYRRFESRMLEEKNDSAIPCRHTYVRNSMKSLNLLRIVQRMPHGKLGHWSVVELAPVLAVAF